MRESSPLARKVREIVEPSLHDMGFRAVMVRIEGGGKGQSKVVLLAEPLEDRPIKLDECAKVSRTVSALLDVNDPVQGAYTLEVSSPGFDRPLVELKDFERYRGLNAKLETNEPIEGRRKFKGRIESLINGNKVKLNVEGVEFVIDEGNIASAKLVVDDELMTFMKNKYSTNPDKETS